MGGTGSFAQLVLRWVTLHGYTISLYNQPLMPLQPPTLSVMGNEYLPRDNGSAPWLGR